MSPLVIDASTALGFILKDEGAATALAALEEVTNGRRMLVPAHWWVEVANGLIMAERRKRMSQADTAEAMSLLGRLPVETDADPGIHAFGKAPALARQYALTIYDAAYLELAMRHGATLATTDAALAKAAGKAGVALLAVRHGRSC